MAEATPEPGTARIATSRWQLEPGRGFAAAAAAAPVLAELGISHLYLSPVAEAVPGSTHGYDVTDPTRLRDELGGVDGFAGLAAACREAGLRLLVDIVPNHLAAHPGNPWWWDLLRFGRASRYAEVFDVDWRAADALVLPVLADHYGRELEAGRLSLGVHDGPGGVLEIRYGDLRLPVRPEAEGAVLAEVARVADDDLLGVAARLLARAEGPSVDLDERDADVAVAERTARARVAVPEVGATLVAEIAGISGDPDRLDLVLGRQHHRLARWTVGDAELDYRRFFDVDSLAATRMDGPRTFDLLHRLPAELLDLDVVDGLRIDHVDGLADPARYLAALRDLAGPSSWLVVEKILRRHEELPPWPVAGATGYEVADLLGGWLTDPSGAEVLVQGWRERTGEDRSYAEVALGARREVLAAGFATDLDRVVDAMVAVCRGRRRHRDHTRAALRRALRAMAAHTDRYRTYVAPDPDGGPPQVSEQDRAVVAHAADAVRAEGSDLDPELLDLLVAVLTGELVGDAEAEVVTRFQQLTGPVAAKGEEDTALYRWTPLPHRCEVGTDPSLPPTTAEEWHAACAVAQERWPERLTTLSTHDTKRSADARARLAALTAEPEALLEAFDTWAGKVATGLDAGSAWLVFYALLAAWPLDLDRAWAVVQKSVREAGLRTSWVHPDAAYEDVLLAVVERAIADPGATDVVEDLLGPREAVADAAALSQLLAQLLAPGVPDLYQGSEGWDRSLVDPDNRRPPDPDAARRLVAAAATTDLAAAWADPDLRRSGLPRTIVVRTALAARRRHLAAVGPGRAGAYEALRVKGDDAGRVLAFARGASPSLAVVVARPRRTSSVGAKVKLPGGGPWTEIFTGATFEGSVPVAALHDAVPVALLER
jgi:(1->4)-alpha-D-glucan 1-alpha-D-glucosylmutase